MATPYFQLRFDDVPSTQDVARERIEDLPLLVVASSQTRGRGRSGARWENADRALAVSLALPGPTDGRPLSLVAGLAAVRATKATGLKWPNDVLENGRKVGGILVETSADSTVIGLGLNLFWVDPPYGATGLFEEDPGEEAHAQLGALWGAELMNLLSQDDWPRDEYLDVCDTIGRRISWDPDGSGRAVDVTTGGALVVETQDGVEEIHAGAIRHVRPD